MKKTKDIKVGGINYIRVVGVPLEKIGERWVFHAKDLARAEMLVAHYIIERGVPLRGLEVRFLRKKLGLTYEKFAGKLGLTGAGVHKWEKKLDERVSGQNEVFLRAFFAQAFGVKRPLNFEQLKGMPATPKFIEIELKAA